MNSKITRLKNELITLLHEQPELKDEIKAAVKEVKKECWRTVER